MNSRRRGQKNRHTLSPEVAQGVLVTLSLARTLHAPFVDKR